MPQHTCDAFCLLGYAVQPQQPRGDRRHRDRRHGFARHAPAPLRMEERQVQPAGSLPGAGRELAVRAPVAAAVQFHHARQYNHFDISWLRFLRSLLTTSLPPSLHCRRSPPQTPSPQNNNNNKTTTKQQQQQQRESVVVLCVA